MEEVMDGMPETVWMRDDQNGGFELTDSGDPVACEYIRADIAELQASEREMRDAWLVAKKLESMATAFAGDRITTGNAVAEDMKAEAANIRHKYKLRANHD